MRPALRKLMGHEKLFRPERTEVFEGSVKKTVQDGKVHLIRVRARHEDGKLVVARSRSSRRTPSR